jgi:transcriptional regulator with XRE-family HTH domain
MINRIREFREAKEWSQQRLADLVGTSQTQIDRLEKNQRRVSDYWLEKLSKALNCSPIDLISKAAKNVPVVGYVGAGALVLPVDDHAQGMGLDEVPSPVGIDDPDIVALRVRGDSQMPMLEDGWLIFYKRSYDGVSHDCIGRLCVVALEDGSVLVKRVRAGSSPRLFHLISHNAEPIFDAKLLWAGRVLDIRPN